MAARGHHKKTQTRYIALEDLDFSWWPEDIKRVCEMWQKGVDIVNISRQLHRDCDEVAILLMDLARQDKICKREHGVFGGEAVC